ncbi:hypothetical protein, partial [Mycobacteroides abscessus]|uniref:hypothetical protein n=1 Tax=Mycobacteroides abscessus TaxID=36809 RepID=UPI001A9C6091
SVIMRPFRPRHTGADQAVYTVTATVPGRYPGSPFLMLWAQSACASLQLPYGGSTCVDAATPAGDAAVAAMAIAPMNPLMSALTVSFIAPNLPVILLW